MNLSYSTHKLIAKLKFRNGELPFSFLIHDIDGEIITIGDNSPDFSVRINNQDGLKAMQSCRQLSIVEAYLIGDLDIKGDLVKAIKLQDILSDRRLWQKFWHHVRPFLFGWKKCNIDWIAKHYNANNAQLLAIDKEYSIYTPGHYECEDDDLTTAVERKLACAFDSLNLKTDNSLLDIGCGWGGFLCYAALRDINATGITLSLDQKQYTESLILSKGLNARVLYQDFFSWKPLQKYDAISLMGVLEHLSDYPQVIKRISNWLKPGGRVFLDFASSKKPFGTCSFIGKYIWPGRFRMVFMPEFIDAIRNSPFEIVSIHNDRRNYYLWAKKVDELWEKNKMKIVEQYDERLWRMFKVLFAGTASVMDRSTHYVTAYRVVLEYPADFEAF